MKNQNDNSVKLNFLEEKIVPVSIYMIFYSLILLPTFINSILIIILSIIWLYLTIVYKENFDLKRLSLLPILLTVYYFIIILGLFYSSDLSDGHHQVEVNLSLVVFPLIFFSGYEILARVKLINVLNHILLAVVIACVYSHLSVTYELITGNHNFFYFTYLNLSQYLDLHPGYFSLYISFSILVILTNFSYYKKRLKYFVYFLIIYLVGFNFLLVSRTSIISLILVGFIFIVFTKNIKKINKFLMFGISALLFLSFLFSSDGKERIVNPINELITEDFERAIKLGTLKYRIRIYNCAFEIVTKEKILFGYGTGAVDNKLFACYINHNYEWIYSQKYNTHSEYLNSLLRAGIVNLLLFISILIIPMILYKNHLPIFFYFLLLFALTSLTENTLNVQKGTVYFGYLYSLFAYYGNKSRFEFYNFQ